MNLFERRRTLLASPLPLKPLIIYNGDIVPNGLWNYNAKLLNGYFDWNFSQQQTASDKKVWKTEDFTIYLPEVKRYKTLNLICENNDIFSYEKIINVLALKRIANGVIISLLFLVLTDIKKLELMIVENRLYQLIYPAGKVVCKQLLELILLLLATM